MNASLEYIADSLIIEALAKDNSMIITAQDGSISSSVAQSVKSYVESQFDKTRPLASITAFLGRGLLWSMGFKWMSVLYTVAEALGFDWKSFWSSVGRGITAFVKTLIESKHKASESEASSSVYGVVQNSFANSFSGDVDKKKLVEIASQGKFASDMRDALRIKEAAIRIQKNPNIVKEASILSLFRGKLARFFIKTISWLVKTALISLGLVSVAGAVSGLVGHKNAPGEEDQGDQDDQPNLPKQQRIQPAKNIPQHMLAVHRNDTSSVWIEKIDIDSIEDLLKNWILSVYPQLSSNMDAIENSTSFQSIVNKFNTRNRLAAGLGMLSVPHPYQRKIDIVSSIVNGLSQENLSQSVSYK